MEGDGGEPKGRWIQKLLEVQGGPNKTSLDLGALHILRGPGTCNMSSDRLRLK